MLFLVLLFYLSPAASSVLSAGSMTYPPSGLPSQILTFSADVSTCTCPSHTRTIWDIIWSCLATIFACSWVSVHPDVPPDGEKWWRDWVRRLEYMFWTLMTPELVIWWAARQWSGARRIQREQQDRGWTVTHGHFMQMGGFMLFDGEERRGTLSYDRFLALLEKDQIQFPNITQKEIEDKSKTDALSKTLVVAQTGWFIVQCIVRRVRGLPISELELSTLAFATLNGFMYFFWWNKPFGVQCPFPVYLVPKTAGREDSKPEPSSYNAPPQTARKSPGWWTLVTWPWSLVLFVGSRLHALGENKYKNQAFDSWNTAEDETPLAGPMHVPTFYSLRRDDDKTDAAAKLIYLVIPLIGSLYGAIHCAAWHFQFPTVKELWIWRIASVIITAIPVVVYFSLLVAIILQELFPILHNAVMVTLCLHVAVYLLARLIILAETISTLRDLPPGSFDAVQWISSIPHV